MARTRADDYDAKRAVIFDRAASLFAEKGFARASIAELAADCRASKSWIYHYFPSKEAILYQILREHMDGLLQAADAALAAAGPPEHQLRALLRTLMAICAGARPRHAILLNELDCLPAPERDEIRELERQLVTRVTDLLGRINPAMMARRRQAKPITMMLFGMINWTHTWYRAEGPLDPEQLADLAAGLFLNGLRAPGAAQRLAG